MQINQINKWNAIACEDIYKTRSTGSIYIYISPWLFGMEYIELSVISMGRYLVILCAFDIEVKLRLNNTNAMFRYTGENGKEYIRHFRIRFICNNRDCGHEWRKYTDDSPVYADICPKCSKFTNAHKIVSCYSFSLSLNIIQCIYLFRCFL